MRSQYAISNHRMENITGSEIGSPVQHCSLVANFPRNQTTFPLEPYPISYSRPQRRIPDATRPNSADQFQ
jgi:hypothetical protein